MRKRLVSGMLAVVLTIGMLSGCGSSEGETAAQTTPDAVAVEEESVKEEAAESEAEPIESVEETEAVEENILWCMDEEGIKNCDMGVMFRRNNEMFVKLSLEPSLDVYLDISGEDHWWNTIECFYYDGDLDSYIAENNGYEKDMYGEYEYAYQIYDGDASLVFAGNGILLKAGVYFDSDADVSEWLPEMNIQTGDGFSQDCLVYTTEEGLYCPALNITILSEEGKNVIGQQVGNVNPTNGGYQHLYLSDVKGNGSAQELVDGFAEKFSDCTALEGTMEQTVGTYHYLGRGAGYNSELMKGTEKWMFVSDESEWVIEFWCAGAEGYETYLSLIEPIY